MTQSRLHVTGYTHSVFSRAVHIGMTELGIPFDWHEADPFAQPVKAHPFGLVPVLDHGSVRIFETWAILTYLDALSFPEKAETPLRAARSVQVAGIATAYAYWPLVRQVYARAVFAPAFGRRQADDGAVIEAGYAAAPRILDALDTIAAEGEVLVASGEGKADWILFPMIDAFCTAARGRAMVTERAALGAWWQRFGQRDGIAQTYAPLEPMS